MSKPAIGGAIVLSVLVAASGCNVCRAVLYDPFGPNTLCDSRRCGLGARAAIAEARCEEPGVAGRMQAEYQPCAPAATPAEPVCCEECGAPMCYRGCGAIRGPLSAVFALLRLGTYRCCGIGENCSGCGERYWGDWYGDPPECCDPCDQYGNFTGGGCGRCDYCTGQVPTMPPTQYAQPDMTTRSSGCKSCGQAGSIPYAGRTPRVSAANSSVYAPRVISTTDRAIKPASAEDQTPHLAKPRTADRP